MPNLNIPISADLLLKVRRAADSAGQTRRMFIIRALEEAAVMQNYKGAWEKPKETPVPKPAAVDTVEPPYHADTRMPTEDAVKMLFPQRLQSQIEKAIRNG